MGGSAFETGLSREIDVVFAAHAHDRPPIKDPRLNYTRAVGFLGDPSAPLWCIPENPSLRGLAIAHAEMGCCATEEVQFRSPSLHDGLIAAQLKDGPPLSLGGWHTFILNLIHEADFAERWKRRPDETPAQARKRQLRASKIWAPVLSWAITQGRPRGLVLLGARVREHVAYLRGEGLLPTSFPSTVGIDHYGYIDNRAEATLRPGNLKRLGPRHPDRVREYKASFCRARDILLGTGGA